LGKTFLQQGHSPYRDPPFLGVFCGCDECFFLLLRALLPPVRFLLDELCGGKKFNVAELRVEVVEDDFFFAEVDDVDEVDAGTTDDCLAVVLPLLLLVVLLLVLVLVLLLVVVLLSSSSTSLSLNNSTTCECIRPLSETEEGGGSDAIEDDAIGDLCNGGGGGGGRAVCVDELHTIGGGGGKPAGLVHCPIFHVSW
jgi:hypothetical protein